MNIDEALLAMSDVCDRIRRERGIPEPIRRDRGIDELVNEDGVTLNIDYIMGYGLGLLTDEPLDTSVASIAAYKEGHVAGLAAGKLMDERYDSGAPEEEQAALRHELIAKARARAVELR